MNLDSSPWLRADDPQIAQLAFCTTDLPLTVHFYRDLLGFSDAGGRAQTGEHLARVQDLPVGKARCIIWWLTNDQDLFNIELFHHTMPRIRERRPDPAEPGWKRCGVVVPDLDGLLSRLAHEGIQPIARDNGPSRRVACIEPGSGVPIDLIEDAPPPLDAGQPGHDPEPVGNLPRAVSVTLGVSDLSWARRIFIDVLGLPEADEDWPAALVPGSRPNDEQPEFGRLALRVGDILLEIVELTDAQPRAGDACLSDQGFMNIAFGFRDESALHGAYDQLTRSGLRATVPAPKGMGACYLTGPDDISLELLLLPRGYEDQVGFAPLPAPRRPR